MKFSVIIITKNEEDNLARTLESIKWCDEIIVVDSGSTDNTLTIAQMYNTKIYFNHFEGFGKQKSFAVSKASNDWILNIDADEVVSAELKIVLQEILTNPNNTLNGYFIPITHCFLNKKFKYGRHSKKIKLRFFNKHFGGFNENLVHETVEIQGNVGYLREEIIHYSYKSLQHYFEKFNTYTDKAAFEFSKKNKKRSLMLNVLLLPINFINLYFIKLNFLNGMEGLVWAIFSSYYTFVKYCKLYELNQKKLN